MNTSMLAAITTATVLVASAAANAATKYTARTSFDNALESSTQTDTFTADITNAVSITTPTGIQSVGANGLGSTINQVSGARWDGKVRTPAGVDGYLSITWTLPAPTRAIGFDFFSISSSRGVEISADWDGTGPQSFVLWDELGDLAEGFFGIIGNAAFTEVTFRADGIGDNDFFHVDNVTFEDGAGIFTDGFQSGNTAAWSTSVP